MLELDLEPELLPVEHTSRYFALDTKASATFPQDDKDRHTMARIKVVMEGMIVDGIVE